MPISVVGTEESEHDVDLEQLAEALHDFNLTTVVMLRPFFSWIGSIHGQVAGRDLRGVLLAVRNMARLDAAREDLARSAALPALVALCASLLPASAPPARRRPAARRSRPRRARPLAPRL